MSMDQRKIKRERIAALLRMKKYHTPIRSGRQAWALGEDDALSTNAALVASFWEASIRAGTFLSDCDIVACRPGRKG